MLDRTILTMSVCINQTKKNKGRCKFSKQCKKMKTDQVALMQHFCLSKTSIVFAKNIIEFSNH